MSRTQVDYQDECVKLRRQVQALQVKLAPSEPGYQSEEFWALFLGQEVTTFRKFVKRHKIPAARWGHRLFVRKEAIEAHLDKVAGVPFRGKTKAKPRR